MVMIVAVKIFRFKNEVLVTNDLDYHSMDEFSDLPDYIGRIYHSEFLNFPTYQHRDFERYKGFDNDSLPGYDDFLSWLGDIVYISIWKIWKTPNKDTLRDDIIINYLNGDNLKKYLEAYKGEIWEKAF